MNFAVPMSHRQQASEDFRGLSEGLIRALSVVKQAKDDEEARKDKDLAREIQKAQLAASQQQQEMGALQLRGAKEEERLLGSMNDFDTRQATGGFGPQLPEEAALPSPLSTRGRGEAFKDSIIAQLRTRRNPGEPVTPEQVAQERADKATARSQAGEEFTLRKGQITAATKASEASTAHSVAETAKTKKETELLGKPKPEDLKNIATMEDNLRQELVKNAGEFVKVRDAYSRVQAVTKQPSAAGDLALIFNFMKMLDPGSTVRETEFANAENAKGVDESIRSVWNKLKTGERLTEAQRADFIGQAANLFDSQKSFYDQSRSYYGELAKRRGLNADNVTKVLDATGEDAAPVKVASEEEYAKLAPGSVYIDPNGIQRRKK